MAEPLKGRTYAWLKSICRSRDVYMGTCILEKDGEDFFDTFILVGPGENDFWSHRKIEPASYEAYFFKGGGLNPNVFDTPMGRIGVSICFDSSKTHTISSLIDGMPEILLITYSCPKLPFITGRAGSKALFFLTGLIQIALTRRGPIHLPSTESTLSD
jgi:N-carbamoylputrescine amidase